MKKIALRVLGIFLPVIIFLAVGKLTTVFAFDGGPINPYSFSAIGGQRVGTISLMWYDDGNENQFNLLYGTNPSNFQYGQISLPDIHNAINTYVVGHLTPGVTYYFSLIGFNGGSTYSSGPITAVASEEDGSPISLSQSLANSANTQPSIPYGFRVDQTSSTTVTFIWTDNGTANRYDIVYGTTPGKYVYGVQNVPFTPGNATAYSIGDLNPDTVYYFELVAERNGIVVAWTNPITALTK